MISEAEIFLPETLAAYYNDIRHVTLPNGLKMEYALHGASDAPEKVVLIMGLMADKEAWLALIATLLDPSNKCSTQCQFVSFDNRGIGGTDKPSELYTTTQMAQDTLQLMDHLGWQKAHIIGISMGGMISQELAATATERVKSLALLVTTPGFVQGATPGLAQLGGYLELTKNLFSRKRHHIAKKMLYVLYTDKYLEEPSDIEGVTRGNRLYNYHFQRLAHSRTSPAGMYGQYSAVLRHHVFAKRLLRIRKAGFPILVVGAKYDRLLHPNNSKVLYQLLKGPNTRSIYFEDAAHGLYVEKRLEMASAIESHLLQLQPSRL
ncbi:serine protease family S33 [Thraustotheca clavata]|uniref:Serine protease family S33 n=1 Tax=Thraustotheca clavata TaxID=74557 RepID=A0A1V9Y966_9STRA|nr:serine protease family S33 [Thraustotheca clavata]